MSRQIKQIYACVSGNAIIGVVEPNMGGEQIHSSCVVEDNHTHRGRQPGHAGQKTPQNHHIGRGGLRHLCISFHHSSSFAGVGGSSVAARCLNSSSASPPRNCTRRPICAERFFEGTFALAPSPCARPGSSTVARGSNSFGGAGVSCDRAFFWSAFSFSACSGARTVARISSISDASAASVFLGRDRKSV